MTIRIENPVHFDALKDINRFFIFGHTDFADQTHLLLASRFPCKFYGFISDNPRNDRHPNSAFSFRYWKDNLHLFAEGDYVFLIGRNREFEQYLSERGVRMGLPFNIRTIYATYETPTFLQFCHTYLKGAGIALDVGGNTGLTAAMLANYCKHVHVFEPNPEMEPVIKATNAGLDNISLHMKAVSNVEGIVNIYSVGTHNTSMVAQDKSDPIKVPCIRIDDFCQEQNIKPQVIKVDVEGVDGEVILGAQKIIETCRPHIFIEHPLANAATYETQRENAETAMAFLDERYQLLAYPTMDQLYDQVALGMPLEQFKKRHGHYPVNVAGIPK